MKSIHSTDYIELISRLRAARVSSGLTQQELARRLNVPQSTVSKVEMCERKLDVLEFFLWAKVLNVPWKKILPPKYVEMED